MTDVQWAAAMGPPGGGRTFVSGRVLRHFSTLACAQVMHVCLLVFVGMCLCVFGLTGTFVSGRVMRHFSTLACAQVRRVCLLFPVGLCLCVCESGARLWRHASTGVFCFKREGGSTAVLNLVVLAVYKYISKKKLVFCLMRS